MNSSRYINEKECSVTLSSNNNSTTKIVGNKPNHKDLKKNTNVKNQTP